METCRNEAERHRNYVFTTAIEGGINYWAAIIDYQWSAPDENGFEGRSEARDFYAEIREFDEESDKVRLISPETIKLGIRRAYENRHIIGDDYQRQAITDLKFGHWDDVDYDATTADIIVQFGLFDELIYG